MGGESAVLTVEREFADLESVIQMLWQDLIRQKCSSGSNCLGLLLKCFYWTTHNQIT